MALLGFRTNDLFSSSPSWPLGLRLNYYLSLLIFFSMMLILFSLRAILLVMLAVLGVCSGLLYTLALMGLAVGFRTVGYTDYLVFST